LAEAECSGLIVDHPRGKRGFGYDPIFYLPSYEKTMAEIEPQLKNRLSHRALAMEKAKVLLRRMSQRGCWPMVKDWESRGSPSD